MRWAADQDRPATAFAQKAASQTPNTAHEGDGWVACVPTWDRESRCEIVRIPALGEPGRGAQPFSFRERNYQKEC
jgi:hypothetical protein